MRETFSAVVMVGLALAMPLAIAVTIIASDTTVSYAVGSDDRDYIPHYEEEAYADDE